MMCIWLAFKTDSAAHKQPQSLAKKHSRSTRARFRPSRCDGGVYGRFRGDPYI